MAYSGRSGGSSGKKSGGSRSARPSRGDSKPTWKKGGSSRGGDDKPAFKRRDDGDDRPKKSFGDKPAFKRREDGDDRPRKTYGDKPAFKKRDEGDDRPRTGRDEGGRGFKKPFGEKPAFKRRDDDDRPRKTYGDKPAFKKREDGDDRPRKPFGDKPAFKRRDDDDHPRKTYGDKPAFKKREDGDDRPRKPFGDKPAFKRRDDDDRPRKPFGDKPAFKRRDDDDRPRKTYGDKPSGDKPFGERRSSSDRPAFKKPFGDRGSKPTWKRGGDRDERSGPPRVRESDGEWKTFDNQDEASAFKKSYSPTKSHRGQDESGDGSIRLNKYIANTGLCSRREADDMIGAGVIKVNGKIVTELGTKIAPSDTVHYGDQLLRREKSVYVLLNKPKDYITTTDDPQERKTVLDLVQGAGDERIYPIGRLDRNTTGILLLTNDGDLAERLMHPKYNVEKIYQVTLDTNLRKEDFDKILEGFELEDGFIKADDLSFVGDGEDKKEIGIVLHSGRNRIVRRMFETLGYVVKHLDRVSYAGLTKKNVQRGKWRFLKPEEVGFLKMKVGGEKQKGRVVGDLGNRGAGRGKKGADKGKPVRKVKKSPETE